VRKIREMPLKDPDARRAYQREYQRKWYRRNREIHKQRVYAATSKRRLLLMRRVNELKQRPCVDCGVSYPPYVMDFDHVAGAKVDDICGMRRRMMDWETILSEAAKCDVVCSNCHRSRTYHRRLGQTPPGTRLAKALAGGYVAVPVPS
jgi:hypothetical protein